METWLYDWASIEVSRRFRRLKGIGMNSAWVDVMEFFAWREFHAPAFQGAAVFIQACDFQVEMAILRPGD